MHKQQPTPSSRSPSVRPDSAAPRNILKWPQGSSGRARSAPIARTSPTAGLTPRGFDRIPSGALESPEACGGGGVSTALGSNQTRSESGQSEGSFLGLRGTGTIPVSGQVAASSASSATSSLNQNSHQWNSLSTHQVYQFHSQKEQALQAIMTQNTRSDLSTKELQNSLNFSNISPKQNSAAAPTPPTQTSTPSKTTTLSKTDSPIDIDAEDAGTESKYKWTASKPSTPASKQKRAPSYLA